MRYLYVALALFVILASMAIYGWYTVQREAYEHHETMDSQVKMEAALNRLSLSYQVVKYTLLEFLIQADEQNYQLYNESVLALWEKYSQLQELSQYKQGRSLTEAEEQLSVALSGLKESLRQIIRIRLDAKQTFPFTDLMLSIAPKNAAVLSVLDRSLLNADSDMAEVPALKTLFENSRYIWVRMMAEFRLLVAVRFGIFTGEWQLAFEQRVRNVKTYMKQIQQNMEEINRLSSAYNEDIELSSDVKSLTKTVEQAIGLYGEAIVVLRTPAWRQDLLYLSNHLSRVFSLVDEALQNMHLQEEASWRNSMGAVTDVAKKLSGSLWLLLMVCSMLAIFGYFMFEQAILTPLRDVARALKGEALGKEVAIEDHTSAYEITLLTDAFHEMRKQVNSRQQRLVNILDNAAEAIITIDKDGIIETFNAAAEDLFDYSANEVLGKSVLMLLPENQRDQYQSLFAAYQSDSGAFNITENPDGYEIEVISKHDQLIPVSVKISKALIEGKVLYTGLVVDISERLAIEKERQQRLAEMAHIGRLSIMGEMATGIAHELNQPLAAISLYLQGSLRRCDPNNEACVDIIKAVKASIEQVDRAGNIIRKMRGFARREAAHHEKVDLNAIIRKSVELVMVGQQNILSEPQLLLAEAPMLVDVDVLQIEQVLVNLIRNAIEALVKVPESARLLKIISNIDDDGFARVFVIDSGEGVAKQHADKIFDTYFTTKEDGLGMGLSICRSIIEGHDGVLWYRARKGQGSQFCFVLPLA